MNWTCPFCNHDQVVTAPQFHGESKNLSLTATKFENCGLEITAVACANSECQEIQLSVRFGSGYWPAHSNQFKLHSGAEEYILRPSSLARPQPPCVPLILAEDYYEACAIRDLSPKASATLSRRVLQGMIRDFCGISKGKLVHEIDELKKRADASTAPIGVALETIDAMHHVRSLGNIGAHMEADINVVVDVDPGEAQQLIELIEMLFKDWYVERDNRQKRLKALKDTADQKALAKTNAKNG